MSSVISTKLVLQLSTLDDMDWTGGVRRRFAPGKNNATLQKQKAHFAKARITLHNTTSSQRSFRPDYHGGATTVSTATSQRQPHQYPRVERDKRERSNAVARSAEYSAERGSGTGYYSAKDREPYPRYHEEQGARRSHSVIYIGSSEPSSPASSTISQSRGKKRKSPGRSSVQDNAMTEEDRLLLANRRRLLARTDWLGLAATRPVQMKFPSTRDKERIGKRRKVDKSASHKGKPAGQRLVTPLFDERLFPYEPMMSGAILPDDIQVRIGTDALASQTQRSHRSQTHGKTSMRQPSTEFGPLSEEPMLLGADGDSFEAMQSPSRALRSTELMMLRAVSPLFDDSEVMRHEQHVPGRPEMRPAVGQAGTDQQLHLSEAGEGSGPDVVISDLVSDFEPPQYLSQALLKNHTETQASMQEQRENALSFQPFDANHVNVNKAATVAGSDADDDEVWRRLLNIKHHDTSHASMAALKSSSLHLATSDSNRPPKVDVAGELMVDTQRTISTPKGAGTQASMIRRPQETASEMHNSVQSESVQSPSASLKQITKLAQQPAPSKQVEEEDDEHALWRQFVCGSQDDSEDLALLAGIEGERATTARLSPAPAIASSFFDISDLGTSNKATVGGDTLVVTGSTSSAIPQMLARRKADLKEGRRFAGLPSSNGAQPAVMDHEDDSIEDDQPRTTDKRQGSNIHAAAASVLNPKRFKRPQNQVAPSPPRHKQFRLSRTAKGRATTNIHSVYDLMDSDGVSIA